MLFCKCSVVYYSTLMLSYMRYLCVCGYCTSLHCIPTYIYIFNGFSIRVGIRFLPFPTPFFRFVFANHFHSILLSSDCLLPYDLCLLRYFATRTAHGLVTMCKMPFCHFLHLSKSTFIVCCVVCSM